MEIKRLRDTKLISSYPELEDWLELKDKLNEIIDYLNRKKGELK